MIIGIDATNIKSDGGIVHLFELINNFKFKKTKIKKIIIWGNWNSLKKIKKDSRVQKIFVDKISSGTTYNFFWQLLFLPSELKKHNCSVLFVLGGVFFNKIVPTVSIFKIFYLSLKMGQKYSFFENKLLIQKNIYQYLSKSDGLIFLSNFSKILRKEISLTKKNNYYSTWCI